MSEKLINIKKRKKKKEKKKNCYKMYNIYLGTQMMRVFRRDELDL